MPGILSMIYTLIYPTADLVPGLRFVIMAELMVYGSRNPVELAGPLQRSEEVKVDTLAFAWLL